MYYYYFDYALILHYSPVVATWYRNRLDIITVNYAHMLFSIEFFNFPSFDWFGHRLIQFPVHTFSNPPLIFYQSTLHRICTHFKYNLSFLFLPFPIVSYFLLLYLNAILSCFRSFLVAKKAIKYKISVFQHSLIDILQ